MAEENKPVQGGGAGVPEGTPDAPTTEVSKETPVSPVVDVDALRSEYETKINALTQDVNKIKSTFQKREAQITQEAQAQIAALKRQVEEVKLSTLTDEDREAYEQNLRDEEIANLREQLEQERMTRAQITQMTDAMNFFLERGVPKEDLVTDEGYDALARSGWNYIDGELSRLREAVKNPKVTKTDPDPLPEAPKVVTDKGAAAAGTNWKSLIATYGSMDAVFRAVEEGRLHPSIIPVE